jgi:hypothetical protein
MYFIRILVSFTGRCPINRALSNGTQKQVYDFLENGSNNFDEISTVDDELVQNTTEK